MRVLVLVAALAATSASQAACLDDCRDELSGGEAYEDCVRECGVCGDGEVEGDEECDGEECCDAACRFQATGTPCAPDDDPCTTDACDGDGECAHEEEPAPDCRQPAEAGASMLVMRDAARDSRDALVWRWRRGAATSREELGDPFAGTSYALCVYDASGLLTAVPAPAAADCEARACWAERRGGLRYRGRTGEPGALTLLSLRPARRHGRAAMLVKATGGDLDLPDLTSLESPLVVQLRRGDAPLCWGATFAFPPARRQGEARFRDRSEPGAPAVTTSTTVAPTSTTVPPPPTTSTTLPGATVEVTVVDAAGRPVEGAEVTIGYGGDGQEASDFTGATGVAVLPGQPVGVAAVVTAEDDGGRTGETSSPGFVAGVNRVTVAVR